ncbi:MAG: DUF1287 domain-containing protein [Akkermansia sp.]|nr:DUF1287 domain-containing protein [Akkermansia sp.]
MKPHPLCKLLSLAFALGFTLPSAANSRLPELARKQIGVTVNYDPDYTVLPYPGGDVPMERGVCTDVVIRALRELGLDLQKAVHEDMRSNFAAYPKLWGLKRPDRNIDHRRVPNLQTYFRRRGWELPITENPADYQPGDIVTCRIDAALFHIMIVSERKAPDGTPCIIHNIGAGTQEEEGLFFFPLTGHYRVRL